MLRTLATRLGFVLIGFLLITEGNTTTLPTGAPVVTVASVKTTVPSNSSVTKPVTILVPGASGGVSVSTTGAGSGTVNGTTVGPKGGTITSQSSVLCLTTAFVLLAMLRKAY